MFQDAYCSAQPKTPNQDNGIGPLACFVALGVLFLAILGAYSALGFVMGILGH